MCLDNITFKINHSLPLYDISESEYIEYKLERNVALSYSLLYFDIMGAIFVGHNVSGVDISFELFEYQHMLSTRHNFEYLILSKDFSKIINKRYTYFPINITTFR